MTIEIQDLTQLDSDLVAQELAAIETQLQERFPEMFLKRGVYHDSLLYAHALLISGHRTNLRRYLAARSLLAIEKDPTLADTGVVDEVLSCWGLERQQGTKASGSITIVLSDNVGVTIGLGARFAASGRDYATTRAYTAKSSAALISNTSDRLLVPLADETYAFTIDVEAEDIGEQYNLAKDTLVIPDTEPPRFIKAYVTSDFAAGTNTETNLELLRRLQQGIAARGMAGRINMAAMLRAEGTFNRIQDLSIVGFGDPEMPRDQHTILPISGGGRVDWYVRTQARIERRTLAKEAVLIEKAATYSIWQFSVVKDDAPGFFEIRNIRPATSTAVSGGFTITEDNRQVDLTEGGFLPDVDPESEEGIYSAYQTTVIRFQDTTSNVESLAVGAKQDYTAEAVCLPLIREIQDFVGSRDARNGGGDCLVKAPVPCFVSLTFTIYKRADEPDPDLVGIRTACAEIVNGVGFIGRLYASPLQDAIHAYLDHDSSAGAIDMLGRIRRPDGTTFYLRSNEVLRITDDPARMVTANTVQFFLEPDDVAVTVETGVPMPV